MEIAGESGKMQKFEDFVRIVKILREKCPWDSVQTHESLKECLKNETAEVLEGIDLLTQYGDGENLKEELGDLLLQVVLHSLIAEEEGLFSDKTSNSHNCARSACNGYSCRPRPMNN